MTSSPGPAPRRIEPFGGPLDADVRLPGSKSITNRALVAAALATGESHLRGVLLADDTDAMLDGLARLGVDVAVDRDRRTVTIVGTGGRLGAAGVEVDARLSGTTSRFLLPVLGLAPGPVRLDGGAPLRRRPMGESIDALRALGATVEEPEGRGHLPVVVSGGPVPGGAVAVRGDASSQFLSGLLLSAPPMADGLEVSVEGPLVSLPYVAMTVAVMRAFGATVHVGGDDRAFAVAGTGYRAADFDVEPDASAASYVLAAAAICGGRVRVAGLGRGALQGDVAFADVLARMGAEVTRTDDAIEVRGTGVLHGVEVDMADISDTAQTFAAVAVFAEGPSEARGIGFIRRKETDRIAAVVTELRRCGIGAEETDDGFRIEPGTPGPAVIETYDDHRMAMSFALLGLRVPGIEIADPGCVAKTFPDYFEVLESMRPDPARATR